ncbi:MAG: hypothetical protein ACLT1W_15395 [Alistipes onderdonkii]
MASVLYYFGLVLFTVTYFIPCAVLFFLTVPFDRERALLPGCLQAPHHLPALPGVENPGRGQGEDRPSRPGRRDQPSSMLDIPLMCVLPLSFKWVSKRCSACRSSGGAAHGDIPVERGRGAAPSG